MILKWETSVLYLFAQKQKHVFGNSHLMMSHRVMRPKDTTLRRFVTTHPPAMWLFRRSLLPCLHPLRNTQTVEQSISFSWKLFFFVFFMEVWHRGHNMMFSGNLKGFLGNDNEDKIKKFWTLSPNILISRYESFVSWPKIRLYFFLQM